MHDNMHDNDIIQIIPGGGWQVRGEVDGKPYVYPLVAWGLRRDGTVVPLDAGSEGLVDELDDLGWTVAPPGGWPE